MEMSCTRHNNIMVPLLGWMIGLLLMSSGLMAQESVKNYTVKNGKMFIELSRTIRESSLDSFINQFQLQELALKEFIQTRNTDQLKRLGWEINRNNDKGIVISKPLSSPDNFNSPADK